MGSPERYRIYALMNVIGRPLTRALGYTPGWTGIGEDLPKGVYLQWTDWVNKPRYLFDDKSLTGLANFAQYKGAIRALCFSDDDWATRPAVELLCSGFTSTQPQIMTVAPGDVGAGKLGHFGFFRADHRDTLWRGAAEWLGTE